MPQQNFSGPFPGAKAITPQNSKPNEKAENRVNLRKLIDTYREIRKNTNQGDRAVEGGPSP